MASPSIHLPLFRRYLQGLQFAVLDEVREWQTRPLDPVYPVVFFDALRVKIRDEGMVRNKAVMRST